MGRRNFNCHTLIVCYNFFLEEIESPCELSFRKQSKIKKFFFIMSSSSVPREVWEFAYLVMSNELKNKFKSSNRIFDKTEEDLPEDPVFFGDKILYLRCLHENILLQQLQNIVAADPTHMNQLLNGTQTSTYSTPISVEVEHADKIDSYVESPTSVMFSPSL